MSVMNYRAMHYEQESHLGHDGFSILTYDIAERHLRTFMFVELELGEIGVRDFVEWDWNCCQQLSLGENYDC